MQFVSTWKEELSPEEFYAAGRGDCDDFAAFSASFFEHFGCLAYVTTVARVGPSISFSN